MRTLRAFQYYDQVWHASSLAHLLIMGRTFECTICRKTFAGKGAHLTSYEHQNHLRDLRERAANIMVTPPRITPTDYGNIDEQEQPTSHVEQGDDMRAGGVLVGMGMDLSGDSDSQGAFACPHAHSLKLLPVDLCTTITQFTVVAPKSLGGVFGRAQRD